MAVLPVSLKSEVVVNPMGNSGTSCRFQACRLVFAFVLGLCAVAVHAGSEKLPTSLSALGAREDGSKWQSGGGPEDPYTTIHRKSYCAMHDICGKGSDGRSMNCPKNVPAVLPSESLSHKIQSLCPLLTGPVCCTEKQFDILKAQVQQAVTFLAGCPACLRNFLNFYCAVSCSPDQSLFINVTEVEDDPETNVSYVEAIDLFVAEKSSIRFYDSCADVKFAAMNTRALDFVGGGATDYREWFAFMGKKAPPYEPGSPFTINFPKSLPRKSTMQPLGIEMVPCNDSLLECSCGDCPTAQDCAPPLPPIPRKAGGCSLALGGMNVACLDLAFGVLYVVYLVAVAVGWAWIKKSEPDVLLGGEGLSEHLLDDDDNTEVKDEIFPAGDAENESLSSQVPAGEAILRWLGVWYRHQGIWIARHPVGVILCTSAIFFFMMLGMLRFEVETAPEKLWVSPGSRAAVERAFFDHHLGPFYRIEQLLVATMPTGNETHAPSIVRDENIRLLFEMQKKVDELTVNVSGRQVSLRDICFRPMGSECATQSVLQYWKMNKERLDDLGGVEHLEFCTQHYTSSIDCLSAFQAPMDPNVVLGGFRGKNFTDAVAFVITYPVDNDANKSDSRYSDALAWEAAFVDLAKNELTAMVNKKGLTFAFSTESSVEAELKRESSADVLTIVVSYLVMFVYVSLTLGSVSKSLPLVVTSKAMLGLSGVLIVIVSVLSAIGLCSALGVKSTLIIVEVIPFLVLAVGVDNMCILVHTMKRQGQSLPVDLRAGNALAEAGPSITLASMAETIAFLVGVLTPMPACRVFSLFAALAVFLDYILQMTVFVALMSLDFRREEMFRVDCVPCMTVRNLKKNDGEEAEDDFNPGVGHSEPSLLNRYMANVHAPILSKEPVKAVVMAVFGGLFFISLGLSSRLQPGLEQQIALPKDSYLQGYFANISDHLEVGPPMYLVVKDLNYTMESGQINQICSIGGCNPNSLVNQVARAARTPQSTLIARPSDSWVDDFLSWISPNAFGCCREFPDQSYCPPDDQPPCCPKDAFDCSEIKSCLNCTTCLFPKDLVNGRPTTGAFRLKLPWFLSANPSADCAKAGHGVYSRSLDLTGFPDSGLIKASEFRTYHTPLRSQADFIAAVRMGREFADQVSKSINIPVFAYSVFYIFFEQYLSIMGTASFALSLASAAVFFVSWLLIGSLHMAAIILGVLVMIMVDLMGVMALWGIQLNAVSVVNLVMALGIGVEFCAHVAQAFMASQGTAEQRARKALVTMGASVFSGITLTKFAGVLVLYFARSEIFVVYYFRMYMALVVLGALHGLCFLPVVLSIFGPQPHFSSLHVQKIWAMG
ncbi:hypothetical protein CBR_g70736 [Chara braunii]|uniref:SSD domain-containing protein n=1 Tax=Chara braunii TaxID=69332 RepID=A0A388KA08_CHABU|nr:hypothetical protein CBR_g70736 [Chara braunii]|eukprot:GBG66859.1 hypothetical protein CBR_g70736 [Chara braunii]